MKLKYILELHKQLDFKIENLISFSEHVEYCSNKVDIEELKQLSKDEFMKVYNIIYLRVDKEVKVELDNLLKRNN